MLKTVLLVILALEGVAATQIMSSWTTWRNCSLTKNCTTRSSQCWIPGMAPTLVECRHGDNNVEEEIHNCTRTCTGTWANKTVLQSCVPSCYNSTMWYEEICSTDLHCMRRSRVPCNNLTLCNGQWSAYNSSCNATCTQPGVITDTKMCTKNNNPSLECAETFGVFEKITFHHPCPASIWSVWVSGSCTRTCGGGINTQRRTCGKTVENRSVTCNTEECPTWGSWIQHNRCLHNIGARSRSCLFNGSIHNNCSGSGPVQVALFECNISTTTVNMAVYANESTIPLVVGLVLLFGILLIAMILLYKKYAKSKIHPATTNGGTDFVFRSSSQTLESNLDENAHDKHNSKADLPVVRIVPYRMPLKDPDYDASFLTVPRTKKGRCKSMDDKLISHLRVPEVIEEERDYYSSDSTVKTDSSLEIAEPSTKQEWLRLRPSLRQAYKDKFVKQDNKIDTSWQRTQTLKHPKNLKKRTSEASGHRRTHSDGGGLDIDDTLSIPMKPTRKNSDMQLNVRSTSLSHSPKPLKPVRNKEMRSASFNVSTMHINSSFLDSEDENSFVFGGISPAKSAPQLDLWTSAPLECLNEISLESSEYEDEFYQPVKEEESSEQESPP